MSIQIIINQNSWNCKLSTHKWETEEVV